MPPVASGADDSSDSGDNPPIDPNVAIANALTAITALLQQQQQQHAPPAAPTHTIVLNLFDSDQPFDLSTRAGNTAYTTACHALDEAWDGNAESFPAFAIALQLRAREVGWSKTGTTNILTISQHNILTDYHQLDFSDVQAARRNRTDPRAIQNAKTMYHCIKASITGDLKTILFEQAANLPNEDGLELFFKLTEYSASSSIALSMTATQRLIHYDPSTRNFNVATINSDLLHLFTMARSPGASLTSAQKLHYTLSAYAKIHQPESWASWIRDQIESIEQGTITECQTFMNAAVLKQQRIRRTEGAFNGSLTTIRDDVVAMMADSRKRNAPKAATPKSTPSSNTSPTASNDKELPPFLKPFKSSTDDSATPYKIGDSKTWKGNTWYFCDCPTHRNKAKWHTHEAHTCNTRKRWLAKKDDTPTANAADAEVIEAPANTAAPETPVDPTDPSDHTALLATIMNAIPHHAEAQGLLADAIAALQTP